jgi:hypothetical protein
MKTLAGAAIPIKNERFDFMKTKLLVITLALLALVGCSKSFDPQTEIPSLAQVQDQRTDGPAFQENVDGVNVLVYKNGPGAGALVVLYNRPDSCLLIDVAGDGTPQLLFKPKSEVFRNCFDMQIKICRNWYPDEDDAYWRCVTRGWMYCAIGAEISAFLLMED